MIEFISEHKYLLDGIIFIVPFLVFIYTLYYLFIFYFRKDVLQTRTTSSKTVIILWIVSLLFLSTLLFALSKVSIYYLDQYFNQILFSSIIYLFLTFIISIIFRVASEWKTSKIVQKIFNILIIIFFIFILPVMIVMIDFPSPGYGPRMKSKDGRRIMIITQTQDALLAYARDNHTFPDDLLKLTPKYTPVIDASFSATNARVRTMYTYYRGTIKNSSSTKIFGYHMGVTLEVSKPQLLSDKDCHGYTTLQSELAPMNENGACVLIPQDVDPLTVRVMTDNYIQHPLWPSENDDFNGRGTNESASSTCATIDMCLYDVSGYIK